MCFAILHMCNYRPEEGDYGHNLSFVEEITLSFLLGNMCRGARSVLGWIDTSGVGFEETARLPHPPSVVCILPPEGLAAEIDCEHIPL